MNRRSALAMSAAAAAVPDVPVRAAAALRVLG